MKGLQKLGKISHISRTGYIVVPADPRNLPKVGSDVVTRKMEKVGFVYDIIGPTKSPFVLVRPRKDVLKRLILEELFVVSAHAGSGKGKRNRKKRSRERGRKKGNRKGRNS